MRLYWVIFFVLFIHSLSAQRNDEENRFGIGVKAGFGLSNTTEPINTSCFSDLSVALNGGVVVLMPLTPRLLSLSSEMVYSIRYFGDDTDDTSYQINYLEFPVLLNIRFFGIEEFYGYRTLNFEIGMGWSKPLKSVVRTDSAKEDIYMPGWYRYAQLVDAFGDPKSQNFFIVGVNSRLSGSGIKTIGIRYTRMLTGLYHNSAGLEGYNLNAKAYCLSLVLSACF
jgi:hypothetical protein